MSSRQHKKHVSRGTYLFRRVIVVLILAAVVSLAFFGVKSVFNSNSVQTGPTTIPTTSSSVSTTQVTSPSVPANGGIGKYSVLLTSDVVKNTVGTSNFLIPTEIYYPSTTSRSSFPLIVFSQGFDISASNYSTLEKQWSSAGFVVAIPTYPYTDPTQGSVNESDIVNHPSDLSAVISAVVVLNTTSDSPLFGLINTNEIGLIGHSDGGDVSLVSSVGSCCKINTIKAAVILSGAELSSFGGSYFAGSESVPMLLVQGTADTINPPECSQQIYNEDPGPKFLLELYGQGHQPPYLPPGPLPIVSNVSTLFLDSVLKHNSNAVTVMMQVASQDSAASMVSTPTVSNLNGTCPGAPGDGAVG